MKTIRTILFVALAAITLASCVKEMDTQNGEQPNTGKMVTFNASIGSLNTKTMIHYEKELPNREFTIRFLEKEHFVLNGKESGNLTKENSSGSQITFQVQDVEAPYYAVSEHHFREYDADNNKYTILVAGTGSPQEYYKVSNSTQTTFYPSSDILAAYSEDETLTFKHMSTFFAITVDKENSTVKDNIKNIYIRQGDGGNIAGTWYLKFNENNEPSLEPDNLSALISYNCVTTNYSPEGIPQGDVMIVSVPSYNYESGLIITIKDVNGKFASYKLASEQTQLADKGGVIIPFNPQFNPQSRTIRTAEDWNEFASCVNAAKKDWDLYTWIGDGIIKLEDNIIADELTPITTTFKYIFDGNKKTITINKAQLPLFTTLTGEIRDLTIAGNMSGVVQVLNDYNTVLGAPFVGNLESGGKLLRCTNNMNVSVGTDDKPVAAHVYASGFVSAMYSGSIEGCNNNGIVNVYVDVSESNHNVGVGGFVGDIRETSTGIALIKDCINSDTADITLTPKSSNSGHGNAMSWCGLGGIAGVLRGATPLTLNNCDNLAEVTLSGDKIKDPQGFYAKVIAVGGIVGLAAPISSGLLADPATISKPYEVSLLNCDNTGIVYNCATNYATTKQGKRLVFTGGLAGALLGGATKFAEVQTCTNTGMVKTHDYTSTTEGVVPSQRPNFCCVAGGLIGYGGYVNISKNCKVQCQICNGKRQLLAWGGVIGYTVRKFSIDNINVDVTGYFASYTGYAGNRAVVAVVPEKCGTSGMEIDPDVEGSTISNSKIKCALYTLTTPLGSSTNATAAAKLDDLTNLNDNPYTNLLLSASDIQGNLVCGQGFTSNSGITIGDNNTYTPVN